MILGPIPHDALADAMVANVEIALWDTGSYVRELAAAARKTHSRAKAHVKINTGLNRLGLESDDLADAVEDYCHIPELRSPVSFRTWQQRKKSTRRTR